MSHPRPHYADHAPLLTPQGDALLRRMEQHAHAPRWNYTCGDQLTATDLPVLEAMRADLAESAAVYSANEPPERVLDAVWADRAAVPHLARVVPATRAALGRQWADLPTISREDLAVRTPDVVPDGADLDRMVIYSTSGTTGHPILIPNHPVGAASYQILLERALARHGVRLPLGPDRMANALVCAQAETIQYASVLSVWDGAGHVKVNLDPAGWWRPGDAAAYLEDFDPPLITGDPVAFAALLDLDPDLRPLALVSTAAALADGLRQRLTDRFGCAVFEWYSMNEAGPVATACPLGHGHHVLDPAVYVEVVDADGRPCAPDERGEVTVTGGRNPMLRLVRYRTGDWASMAFGACPCGDPAPRLVGLDGRAPVVFRTPAGALVNPVDVSRVLRPYPLVQHQLVQHADGAFTLALRPTASGVDIAAVEADLRALIGTADLDVRVVREIEGMGPGGKVVPYVRE